MAESAEHEERRKHKRSPVLSGVIAVLITSAPEVIGAVSDISLGGAKVTYHNPKNRKIDFATFKLDLISDDRFVEAIPCSNAWDNALVENNDFIAVGDLRQCGIQFEGLNPNQLFLLRGFINRCALDNIIPQTQLENPAPVNQ
ncbi:MAG: PilZ domain-containing protein [Deltaproteobacteria bacterium]|jgi:c-di-GMP-binding flagellar brake protein YcgR|nr:PilZ domain-containing protein [Deltaproteobacteria bacterium]